MIIIIILIIKYTYIINYNNNILRYIRRLPLGGIS